MKKKSIIVESQLQEKWEGKNVRERNVGSVWILECHKCKKEWNDNDPHVWVECNTCGNKYHLEHSGIQYKMQDYWKISLDIFQFECSEGKELFEGCWE